MLITLILLRDSRITKSWYKFIWEDIGMGFILRPRFFQIYVSISLGNWVLSHLRFAHFDSVLAHFATYVEMKGLLGEVVIKIFHLIPHTGTLWEKSFRFPICTCEEPPLNITQIYITHCIHVAVEKSACNRQTLNRF